jgi:DNA primase
MRADAPTDLVEIKRISIEAVADRLGIKMRGRTARCPYPQHDDKNPSFQLYPEENRCWCHRCGKGGTVIDLVSLTLDLGVGEAIRWLRTEFSGSAPARRHVYKPSRQMGERIEMPSPPSEHRASPELYAALLEFCPLDAAGLAYLRARGFADETIRHFRLGSLRDPNGAYASLVQRFGGDRVRHAGLAKEKFSGLVLQSPSILFPFFFEDRVDYLQARKLPDGALPKWSGPRGVAKPVFNLSVVSNAKSIYICEGATDVMAAHQLGYAAIGLLGGTTRLPMDVVRALRGRSIYIVPDNDAVGESMVTRVKAQLKSAGLSATTKRLPVGEDLSDFVRIKRGGK